MECRITCKNCILQFSCQFQYEVHSNREQEAIDYVEALSSLSVPQRFLSPFAETIHNLALQVFHGSTFGVPSNPVEKSRSLFSGRTMNYRWTMPQMEEAGCADLPETDVRSFRQTHSLRLHKVRYLYSFFIIGSRCTQALRSHDVTSPPIFMSSKQRVVSFRYRGPPSASPPACLPRNRNRP